MRERIFIEKIYSSAILMRNPESGKWQVMSLYFHVLNAIRLALPLSVSMESTLVVVERGAAPVVVSGGRILPDVSVLVEVLWVK